MWDRIRGNKHQAKWDGQIADVRRRRWLLTIARPDAATALLRHSGAGHRRELIEVATQLFAQVRMAQFAQCNGFDLSNTLAGDTKFDADFFESAVAPIF